MQETTRIDHQRTEQADATARVQRIRARLPGQIYRDRVDNAAAEYGPLFTLAEIRQKVADTLPSRLGYRRSTILEPIESYRERIPDDALLKYDDAQASGLFSKFWVATPIYMQERQVDPWILGEVEEANAYAVIARWD